MSRLARPERVLNQPALIRWNLDKRYLLDLEAHGVSIVPTRVAASLAEVHPAAIAIGGRIVVKPNVGVGSQGAHITSADDPKLDGYAAELLDAGKLVLVEPEIPEIGLALGAGATPLYARYDMVTGATLHPPPR